MANSSNKKDEPNTAPQPDRWYNLTLGSSFKDHHPSSKFCTLRSAKETETWLIYNVICNLGASNEFKPASIDKNQPGTLHKNKENRVTVEFSNNQHGKPKVSFEGSSEDYKENDAVLFFDGETFRLERLHRAVKRLRHVRLPGESAAAAASTSVGQPGEASSPPIGKAAKSQSLNKGILPVPVEVEQIEIGDFKSSVSDSHLPVPDAKPRNGKVVGHPSAYPNSFNASPDLKNTPIRSPDLKNTSISSPDLKMDDLEEQLDILNDDDDATPAANGENVAEREFRTGIDINIPHPNDTDDEIADVDASDDEVDKGPNAAEALRAQVNAAEKDGQSSSSSSSSGSDSSGSGSASGSGSGSSSSDSDSSDGDSVTSI
ncbi:hypothetical protein RJ640_010967 [Escallonia rubra]|uniref:Transcription elongation factor Eaf N-terminal domain-containing protein n=1 Tax=Escallonia rubra TaxID=112253 RepID=A0AA88RHS9_9ASTE|nr:hypothetical protein RJ640_010967 [Escallonia rubra]